MPHAKKPQTGEPLEVEPSGDPTEPPVIDSKSVHSVITEIAKANSGLEVAEVIQKVYSQAWKEGLAAGLELEKRQPPRKGFWD